MRLLSCASQSRRRKEKDESADLVLLATPSFLSVHLQSAVELGKHVFCEKPVVPLTSRSPPDGGISKTGEAKVTCHDVGFLLALRTWVAMRFPNPASCRNLDLNQCLGVKANYVASHETFALRPVPVSGGNLVCS
jgi:hypothetical protein